MGEEALVVVIEGELRIADGNESKFENGIYIGYEVKLRVERDRMHEPFQVQTPADIFRFMKDINRESSEHVYEVLMDGRSRITGVYLVGKGCSDQSPGDAFEAYKAALVTNSRNIAIVHNHPSGVVNPSPEDRALAQRIHTGAELLGLNCLDFLIVGDGRYFSFSEVGLMPQKK